MAPVPNDGAPAWENHHGTAIADNVNKSTHATASRTARLLKTRVAISFVKEARLILE